MKNLIKNGKNYLVMVAAPAAVMVVILGSIKLVYREEN